MTSAARRKRRTAIRKAREQHRETIARRYYLTLTKRKTKCHICGGTRPTGSEIVYRHDPQSILCPNCAEKCKVEVRLSSRIEAVMAERRGLDLGRQTPGRETLRPC